MNRFIPLWFIDAILLILPIIPGALLLQDMKDSNKVETTTWLVAILIVIICFICIINPEQYRLSRLLSLRMQGFIEGIYLIFLLIIGLGILVKPLGQKNQIEMAPLPESTCIAILAWFIFMIVRMFGALLIQLYYDHEDDRSLVSQLSIRGESKFSESLTSNNNDSKDSKLQDQDIYNLP